MRNFNSIFRLLASTAALLLTLATSVAALAQTSRYYVRGALGMDWPQDTEFSDRNCASTQPPALFGCGTGSDGNPLAGRGKFDQGPGIELALGYRVNSTFRLEALLNYRDSPDFEGQANFRNVSGGQPVSTESSAFSAFAVLLTDLPAVGVVQPYAGLGLGLSHNRNSQVRYEFPGLGPTAATLTPAGTHTETAWLLTAGAALPLSARMQLDLAFRYTDQGEMSSDSGPATIIRNSGIRSLNIDATKAELRSKGVVLGLRYQF